MSDEITDELDNQAMRQLQQQVADLKAEIERLNKQIEEHKFTIKLANNVYDEFIKQLAEEERK